MSVSEKIRALAREGLEVADVARRLGIRYQHAYNVMKRPRERASDVIDPERCPSLSPINSLVLVSCVSQKLSQPAPARLLYRSEWFLKVRKLVESQGGDWLILSALYGVVAPDMEIAPYEKTLNTAGVIERRAWAEKSIGQLEPHMIGHRRVVIFAGQRYREFLVPALRRDGNEVDVPMANLRIGEQLAWLSAQS